MHLQHFLVLIGLCPHLFCRDSIGDSAIAGDLRWAGSFGVNIDFVARSHCSVEFITIEDMQASFMLEIMTDLLLCLVHIFLLSF